jgi:hypothetical protein
VTVVVAARDRREHLLANLPRQLELPERPRVIVGDVLAAVSRRARSAAV